MDVSQPLQASPIYICNFTVAGKPVWGTLIALLHDGQPVLGVIDQPIAKERWVGVAGKPSTLNGAVIQTFGDTDIHWKSQACAAPHIAIMDA